MTPDRILEARKIVKPFGHVQALNGVNPTAAIGLEAAYKASC